MYLLVTSRLVCSSTSSVNKTKKLMACAPVRELGTGRLVPTLSRTRSGHCSKTCALPSLSVGLLACGYGGGCILTVPRADPTARCWWTRWCDNVSVVFKTRSDTVSLDYVELTMELTAKLRSTVILYTRLLHLYKHHSI